MEGCCANLPCAHRFGLCRVEASPLSRHFPFLVADGTVTPYAEATDLTVPIWYRNVMVLHSLLAGYHGAGGNELEAGRRKNELLCSSRRINSRRDTSIQPSRR